MSVVFDTKVAVFATIKARFSGTGALVSWGDPGTDARTTSLWWTDTVEPSLTPRAMVQGRRKPTDVEAELTLRIVCAAPGDPINAERKTYATRAEVEAAVLDDFDPATVPGLVDLRPVRADTTAGESPLGTASMCDFVMKLRARVQS